MGRRSKLSVQKRKQLVFGLCQSFASLNTSSEVAEALTDLLTPQEVEAIAKRLQISAFLVEGKSYQEIRDDLKVGFSTIARVNTWLNLSGEGYRKLLAKRKKEGKKDNLEDQFDPFGWQNIKRRYSLYFWPQLLIEELLKNANEREKKKIHSVFESLEKKGKMFSSEHNKELYEQFNSTISKKPQSIDIAKKTDNS